MLSKLYRAPGLPQCLRLDKVHAPLRKLSRFPKQYEQPSSDKFRIFHVLRHHWELSPLIFIVCFDMFIMCAAIYYGFKDSVDIQLTGHNWNCISRNMDLRHPTVHKHLVLNQRYEPWPRLQAVLDKMADNETEQCPLRQHKSKITSWFSS